MKSIIRIAFIASLLFLSSGNIKAQIFSKLKPKQSAESTTVAPTAVGSSIVVSALKDAMCLLRIEYQLEDPKTEKRFNVEDKNYFGFAEGVCIKISNGWIAPTVMAEPWAGNNNLKSYAEYTPVVSSITVMDPGDSTYKEIGTPLINGRTQIHSSKFSIMKDSTNKLSSGLVTGHTSGQEEGYIVWLYKDGNKLDVSARSYTIEPKDSSVVSLAGVMLPAETLGGIFVKPTFPQGGIVYFEVLGVMEKVADEWKINIIESGSETTPVEDVPEEKLKLVPADKKK